MGKEMRTGKEGVNIDMYNFDEPSQSTTHYLRLY